MPDITITLTTDENTLLTEMLDGQTLENYIKGLVANYDKLKLEDEWNNKSESEKRTLLS